MKLILILFDPATMSFNLLTHARDTGSIGPRSLLDLEILSQLNKQQSKRERERERERKKERERERLTD